MKSKSFSIKKQYIQYSDETWGNYKLHPFQKKFLNDDLSKISVISAPTGAGKTFGFGLLLDKEKNLHKLERNRKLLVVSPTKILCQQVKNDIRGMYEDKDIVVQILNSDKLNKLGNKGYKRWQDVLKITEESDVVVATPDIINWIITSGYFFKEQTKTVGNWMEFFKGFTHIIVDEFHLYDQEQIANVLVWQQVYQVLPENRQAKLIFVSATPNDWLFRYLKEGDYDFEKINTNVTTKENNSRCIHGRLKVNIIREEDGGIYDYFSSNSIYKKWDVKNNTLLCIYNSLKNLHQERKNFELEYEDLRISEISGYDQSYKENAEVLDADIILGTSAIEQGVNIGVNNAILLGGFSANSFIQRFGRIARGDYQGNISIIVPENRFGVFENCNKSKLDVDKFYGLVRKSYQNNFEEKIHIANYMGAFWFVILNELDRFSNLKKVIKENVFDNINNAQTKKTYSLLLGLKIAINKIKENREVKEDLNDFFNNFLKTFKYFRKSGVKSVNVYDESLDLETEYSYDWLLRNKEVIKTSEDKWVVCNQNEPNRNSDIKYIVSSLPAYRELQIELEKYELYSNPVNTYKEKIYEYFNNASIEKRNRNTSDNLKEIFQKLKYLTPIINSKRFLIKEAIIKDTVDNII